MKRPRLSLHTTAGGGSDWSSLPGDLLEQISGYLSTDADRLHIHQQEVPIGAPPAGAPYCCGASRGWLALTDNAISPTRLVLWDPASGAEVRLPPLPGVTQVFLSSDPLASPDWTAVAGQRYGYLGAQKSFFCRPGDAAWSVLCDRPTAGIDSVAFHGGRIYWLDWQQVLVVCDLNLGPAPHVQISSIWGPMSRLCSCDSYHDIRGAHMVSCAGDLLLVILRRGSGHSSFAEIYKLECPPERGQPLELGDRVTDLGNHSLFLARSDNLALSAEEFPAIRRNHVYFLEFDGDYSRSYDHAWPDDWAFVLDLGSGTLKKIPYPGEFRDEGRNWQPLFWLCSRSPFMKQQQCLTGK